MLRACDIFSGNTIENQQQLLADYFPNDRMWTAKNIPESTLFKFIYGLGNEIMMVEDLMNEISCEYDINNTTQLIDEWERALGLPDSCLRIPTTIQERRDRVILKLALMNVATEQDFIDLAARLGFTITIRSGAENSIFPACFPMNFCSSPKDARFTMVIHIVTPPPTTTFPMCFPYCWTECAQAVLMCLFAKLKPAVVKLELSEC